MKERVPEAIYAVYTPGKVATTTTHSALSSALDVPVYNIRVGTEEGIATYVETFQKRFNRPLPTDEIAFDKARRTTPDARLKLVTLTREPVAAAVSNWFYGFERNHPGEHPADWSLTRHRDAIVDGQYAHRRDYFTGWLTYECRELTGIDPYEAPFPISKGYELFSSKSSDLLIIRAESLNRVFRPAFQALVGVDIEILESKNKAEDLSYADTYSEFKEQPGLPPEFIDEHHETEYARNFYAPDELNAARIFWTRN